MSCMTCTPLAQLAAAPSCAEDWWWDYAATLPEPGRRQADGVLCLDAAGTALLLMPRF